MNNKDEFILEMNEIKPREELLENTINLIRQKELNKNMKEFNYNKIVIAFATLVGITTSCFAGYKIVSKRFKSIDMMGISMETELDEEFSDGYFGDFSMLSNQDNFITVYKQKKNEIEELDDSEGSLGYDFENLKEDGYKTLEKYYYMENNLIEDLEDFKTYISTEEIKKIIKNKEKYGDLYYENLNIKEGFKILSKQNIQKDGIKGIRYSYSYEGTDSPVTIYILSVKDKIYKITLHKFHYYNIDRYDELQKVINSIELAY